MESENIGKEKDYPKLLTELFKFGVAKVQPRNILKDFLSVNKDKIIVKDKEKRVVYSKINKIFCLCIGKASIDMAKTARDILIKTKKLSKGIVVVNKENFKKIDGFECFCSGHPIPNKEGHIAAKSIEENLKNLTKDDLVLIFISGGGSALLSYPAKGISLNDKKELNKILLESGANIKEINSVRKHISLIKGGNLARMCFPSRVHSFILSDVVGDDLSSIASGMTIPDNSTFQDVIKILRKHKIWNKIPKNVKNHIIKGLENFDLETPKKNNSIFQNVSNTLIGSNTLCLKEIHNLCKQKKIKSKIWFKNIEDDVMQLSKKFIKRLYDKNFPHPILLISGGETTVKIKGKGKGGRNQEFALHFIKQIKKSLPLMKFFLLSAGTDGRDGPTDAAGGIVNYKSIEQIKLMNLNLSKELEINNSYEVLKKINSLVIIKGTNTNVADVQLLMLI